MRVGEYAQVDEGSRQLALALQEQDDASYADNEREPHQGFEYAHVCGGREPEQQATHSEGREHEGKPIERGMGIYRLSVAHHEKSEREKDGGRRHENQEHEAPAKRVAEKAADGRTDVGCEAERDAREAHGGAMPSLGKARHGDGLQKRHENAGAHGLQDATDDEHGKGHGHEIAERSDEIEAVRDEHQ